LHIIHPDWRMMDIPGTYFERNLGGRNRPKTMYPPTPPVLGGHCCQYLNRISYLLGFSVN
jgi:hypothetical protein